MAGQIKCSYEDCSRSFRSHQLMIQHKIKEPMHEYCRRCDVDCDDDVAFLIHQMNNPKHIACCMCGEEFRSEAGRDTHVELYHQRSQDLPCPGCGTIFSKAGALMYHIEKDECKVISADVYQRRKAEKQVEKDAWAEALDTSNIRSFLPSQAGVGSETETNGGGVSLLDDDHMHSGGQSGQGTTPQNAVSTPPQAVPPGLDTAPSTQIRSTGALSMKNYPTLPTQHRTSTTEPVLTEQSLNDKDLLSFDEAETKPRKVVGGPWNSRTAPSSLFTASRSAFPKPCDSDNGSVLDSSSNVSPGTKPNPQIDMFDRLSHLSIANSQLSPEAQSMSATAPPPNPNFNARVRAVPAALADKSTLDPWRYFDPLQNCFVCPGMRCHARYATPQEFDEHLVSNAHVGGKTVCPSCLRRFNTTAALISHCESGSRRCNIRKSVNYNQIIRELTAGMLGTEGHLIDGSVRYVANKPEDWQRAK